MKVNTSFPETKEEAKEDGRILYILRSSSSLLYVKQLYTTKSNFRHSLCLSHRDSISQIILCKSPVKCSSPVYMVGWSQNQFSPQQCLLAFLPLNTPTLNVINGGVVQTFSPNLHFIYKFRVIAFEKVCAQHCLWKV